MKQEQSPNKARGNLIPNSDRSPEQLREMGRKGGIKSGEARRRKRDLLEAFRIYMDVTKDMDEKQIERLHSVLARLGKQ